MRTPATVSVLLTFLIALAAAVQTERTIDIFAWPLSAANPQPLASLAYTTTNASIKSYSEPKFHSSDETVRVGFYHQSGQWSGIATSASNFAPNKPKNLQLHVRDDGQIFHVGFKTVDPVGQGRGKPLNTKDGLSVEVVKIQRGPVPILNKPIVVSADGEVEKEPEKTFLQKYWWAIGLFLLLQLALGGGGGKE